MLLGEVIDFDLDGTRGASRSDGARSPYDTLIVATGATHHYFGHDEWEQLAPA